MLFGGFPLILSGLDGFRRRTVVVWSKIGVLSDHDRVSMYFAIALQSPELITQSGLTHAFH
jgi:hypothetical protein